MLLVDNDDSLRRALARAVRLAGFDVQSFPSAETLLERGIPDGDVCLVLDVALPGIGGIELTRTLIDSKRNLPTIFITALEAEEVGEQLAALEPVTVLYKPFGTEELLDAVGRVCEGY